MALEFNVHGYSFRVHPETGRVERARMGAGCRVVWQLSTYPAALDEAELVLERARNTRANATLARNLYQPVTLW